MMDKSKYILFVLFVIAIGLAITIGRIGWHDVECRCECDYSNCITNDERCVMYNFTNVLKARVNGIYYHDWGYCVWTQNRTLEDIYRTDCHEICHDLVYKDYEHFCEKD